MKLKTNGLFGIVLEDRDLAQLGLSAYAALTDALHRHDLTFRDCCNMRTNHGLRSDKRLPDSLTQGETDAMLAYFAFIAAFDERFGMEPRIGQIGASGDVHIWLPFTELFAITDNGAALHAAIPINLSNIEPLT